MKNISCTDESGCNIEVTGDMKISVPGTYSLTYTATDAVGHKNSKTKTITIINSEVFNYNYTGSYQSFTSNYSGIYKIELFGASGGAPGGYVKGNTSLTKGETLYVQVGGKPNGSIGGYNGGGNDATITYYTPTGKRGSGGGGSAATAYDFQHTAFGGGGSSFISGYTGCNAINSSGVHTNQPNHYSGKVFTDATMKRGNESGIPNYGGWEVNNTNGYARITLIGINY